jgi:4-hydroxyphenylpyruvate dioxygenase-like putative hemolysin
VVRVDYLARAIVDLFSLFRELAMLWANGQGDVTANVAAHTNAQVGDTMSSMFSSGVNFIAQLATEILHQMGNTTP